MDLKNYYRLLMDMSGGQYVLNKDFVFGVNIMFTTCVCIAFGSKYVQFSIIWSLQFNINNNPVEVNSH